MHFLDWLDSPRFLPTLRDFVAEIGFVISDDAEYQPKGRADPRESRLVGRNEPFLSLAQQKLLSNWWLEFTHGENYRPGIWSSPREMRLLDHR